MSSLSMSRRSGLFVSLPKPVLTGRARGVDILEVLSIVVVGGLGGGAGFSKVPRIARTAGFTDAAAASRLSWASMGADDGSSILLDSRSAGICGCNLLCCLCNSARRRVATAMDAPMILHD